MRDRKCEGLHCREVLQCAALFLCHTQKVECKFSGQQNTYKTEDPGSKSETETEKERVTERIEMEERIAALS
jgi:hypothetical protein